MFVTSFARTQNILKDIHYNLNFNQLKQLINSFTTLVLICLGISNLQAQVSIKRSAMSCFGPSTITSTNFSIQQTAGQASIVSTWFSEDASVNLRQGFIQPPISVNIPTPITLKSFYLFPNPTNGEVNFLVELEGNNTMYHYEIKNMLGQNIQVGKGESTFTQKIDLSDAADGMYFLSIRNHRKEILTTQKIILTK
jgi:hypothetical protein